MPSKDLSLRLVCLERSSRRKLAIVKWNDERWERTIYEGDRNAVHRFFEGALCHWKRPAINHIDMETHAAQIYHRPFTAHDLYPNKTR